MTDSADPKQYSIKINKNFDYYTNAQTIKNDVFWNTADGKPLYSQGGGIFK